MKCSRCQHENPSGVSFCGECGARLETLCPGCQASNPPTNKFCHKCGAPLTQAPSATKFAAPEAYTPKHLAEKILTSKNLPRALTVLERGLDLCQAWNIPASLHVTAAALGFAYALSGRVAEGLPLLEHATEQAAVNGILLWHSLTVVWLGEAHLLAGRPDDAMEAAGLALRLSRERKERGHEAWAFRLLGEIASHRDPADTERAEDHYRQARALAEELGMRPLVAHCHLGLGKLYRCTGDRPKAQEHLTTVTTMLREMDMHFWLEQAEVELKALGVKATKKAKRRT